MNISERKYAANSSVFAVVLLTLCFGLFSCDKQGQSNSKVLAIGLITNNPNGMINVQGFKDGMKALGYVEGEDVRYLFAGHPVVKKELTNALKAMVDAEVDLIFTAGTPTGVAASKVTSGTDIPVVFGVIADPVASGIMQDLTHPGGNITGVKLSQSQAKRLELFLEIAPAVKNILVPYNPSDTAAVSSVVQISEIATPLGINLVEAKASNADEVAALLDRMPESIDAIFLVPDSTVNSHLKDIVKLAIQRELPLSGPSTIQVEGGALTGYGIVHRKAGEQAARIAHRILRGANPGDIPVETAEFFQSINLATAEKIGIEISDDIIDQADFVFHSIQ